jgi:hypothetical protein
MLTNPLGDPPALPGRQQKLDISRSVYHSLLVLKAVYDRAYVHEHDNDNGIRRT